MIDRSMRAPVSHYRFWIVLALVGGGIGYLFQGLGVWGLAWQKFGTFFELFQGKLSWAYLPLFGVVLVHVVIGMRLYKVRSRIGQLELDDVHALIRIEMAASKAGLLGAACGIVVTLIASYAGRADQAAQLVKYSALAVALLSPISCLILSMIAESQISGIEDQELPGVGEDDAMQHGQSSDGYLRA